MKDLDKNVRWKTLTLVSGNFQKRFPNLTNSVCPQLKNVCPDETFSPIRCEEKNWENIMKKDKH